MGSLTPAEIDELKEFLNEFDQENSKNNDTNPKDPTDKEV